MTVNMQSPRRAGGNREDAGRAPAPPLPEPSGSPAYFPCHQALDTHSRRPWLVSKAEQIGDLEKPQGGGWTGESKGEQGSSCQDNGAQLNSSDISWQNCGAKSPNWHEKPNVQLNEISRRVCPQGLPTVHPIVSESILFLSAQYKTYFSPQPSCDQQTDSKTPGSFCG